MCRAVETVTGELLHCITDLERHGIHVAARERLMWDGFRQGDDDCFCTFDDLEAVLNRVGIDWKVSDLIPDDIVLLDPTPLEARTPKAASR